MKISDIKQLKEGTLSIDVPNEDWLQDKIDYARSKGRNSYGVPYMGSTTASVRGAPPRVRVLRLASLPGMRNEQSNVRKDDLKWLMDYMDKNKRLPPANDPNEEYLPYIMVAYNGEAWVNEGNHRIMAAYRLNWPDMPIEIRYFDGGERIKDGAMYPGKIGLGEVDVPKSESMTEIFEPGKQNWKWRRQSSDEAFASFIVGDREYQWHAFNSDANTTKWEIQFRLMRVPADPDGLDLFGQTGTGNSAQVLSTAVDITRAFLQAYGLDKVEEITFNAKEDSRIDLYAKMIKRLLPTWELSNRKSQSHGMQFTLTDPRAYDKPENKVTEKIDPDILHPDYKFQQKIGKFNYTASSYAGNGGKPMLKIEASDKVGTVGHAYFTVVNDAKGGHLESLNTYVHDDFQKKNIATTMYTIAKMLGNDIKPSSSLLPGGQAMWKSWKKSGDAKHLANNESTVMEGGWASVETQNTVITPRIVAEIVHILDGFADSYNAWQAANELDTEIKIGQPKGSGTYYRRDLEQDPDREYGDVDIECFVHSREGVKSAQRITEYRRAIDSYCAQSPDFSTDNGTNIIMRTTAGPAQVDLIYTYHEHADWSRVLSPEYRVKGVISTSLTSSIAEALNLSFSSQGIQVKIRNNQPVSFRQSKDTELRTVSINPDAWAQDIYSLYYYLSHGEKPAEMPRDLRAHGGLKDEQRLSDIVLSIKALASGLEEANLLAHGALIDIRDKKDLIRRVAQIYSAKLEAAETSSKFDKASTPVAVEKAKKTKLMLAKYRNEVTKLLLN